MMRRQMVGPSPATAELFSAALELERSYRIIAIGLETMRRRRAARSHKNGRNADDVETSSVMQPEHAPVLSWTPTPFVTIRRRRASTGVVPVRPVAAREVPPMRCFRPRRRKERPIRTAANATAQAAISDTRASAPAGTVHRSPL